MAEKEKENQGLGSRDRLPLFGVGPIYVIFCLIMTLLGLALHHFGYLEMGKIIRGKWLMQLAGLALILLGVYFWLRAVVFEDVRERIEEGQLVTTGVYALVRHPIYSAFTFAFTGILLLAANLYLLVLPPIFWLFLTFLMIKTEEKWLRQKFGEEYERYCREVNRIIPSFRKRKADEI